MKIILATFVAAPAVAAIFTLAGLYPPAQPDPTLTVTLPEFENRTDLETVKQMRELLEQREISPNKDGNYILRVYHKDTDCISEYTVNPDGDIVFGPVEIAEDVTGRF